jgi:hypothetical protein
MMICSGAGGGFGAWPEAALPHNIADARRPERNMAPP